MDSLVIELFNWLYVEFWIREVAKSKVNINILILTFFLSFHILTIKFFLWSISALYRIYNRRYLIEILYGVWIQILFDRMFYAETHYLHEPKEL